VFVGLCTLDVIHHVDLAPGADEKVTARSQFVAAGGPATNAAVTFSALGGAATLVTALGHGGAADIVRADLAACGVHLVDIAAGQVDRVPISSVVVSASGERSIVSVDDAGATELDEIPDLTGLFDRADVTLIDGHHPALVTEAARAARARSVPVVLDAGRWRPVMSGLLSDADVVICSADFRFPGTHDLQMSARMLVEQDVPVVIVTHGADPVLWWQHGRTGSVSPPAVRAVDTAGAGDVFHGAFCSRIADDLVAAVTFANEVAALKCRFPGTRRWLAAMRSRPEDFGNQTNG
jgi:sugar/nucleoside kinase (ribokinase family)